MYLCTPKREQSHEWTLLEEVVDAAQKTLGPLLRFDWLSTSQMQQNLRENLFLNLLLHNSLYSDLCIVQQNQDMGTCCFMSQELFTYTTVIELLNYMLLYHHTAFSTFLHAVYLLSNGAMNNTQLIIPFVWRFGFKDNDYV
jgi:hypothetical protein